MTKYLFLLGFFLCSISFLSTGGYEVYQGVVYESRNDYAVNCANRKGVLKRLTSLIAAKEDREKADVPVGHCQEGGFERFILFEEVVERTSNFKFVRSFVSPKIEGADWRVRYLEMRTDVQIIPCDNVQDERAEECKTNLAVYDKNKIDIENNIVFTVASWNIAWLGDGIQDEKLFGNSKSGQFLRTDSDYNRLQIYADNLGASIVALQEVENEAAARKVFPKNKWQIFISSRNTAPQWAQKTAIAVRNGIRVTKKPDVKLSRSNNLRYGVDLEIEIGKESIRFLSIHLKSGCFEDSLSIDKDACNKLAKQLPYLEEWIDARAQNGTAFIIAGDWNRRLALPKDEVWLELNDGEPKNLQLHLTADKKPACWDGKYKHFIDHIVLGGPTTKWFRNFTEYIYNESENLKSKLSDHCAVSVQIFESG